MSRILTDATQGQHGAGVDVDAAGNPMRSSLRTFYVWGAFGAAAATVKLELSPDGIDTPDVSSNWFDSGIALSAAGFVNIEARYRKARGFVSGGDAGTLINAVLV